MAQEFEHKIRSIDPDLAARVQAEMAVLGFAAQQEATKQASFGGKFDHEITIGGASKAAMDAIKAMVGNEPTVQLQAGLPQFSQRCNGGFSR